jgi:hypothetical protein
MNTRLTLLTGCATILLSIGIAQAGPCTTANKDAGSGPTPGAASQATTTGTATRSEEHPPTASMNKAAGNAATSSQDAQRQTQGKPTAAQEAQGGKGATGNDC